MEPILKQHQCSDAQWTSKELTATLSMQLQLRNEVSATKAVRLMEQLRNSLFKEHFDSQLE